MNFLKSINRNSAFVIEASAGTGKTYTIKEIVLQVLKNEYKQDREWSIRKMLIVTFTEKAAQELQTRIRKSIQEEIENPSFKNEESYQRFLKQNLAEVDLADITTIHGFCNKVLARFSFELSLSRQMNLVDKSDLNSDQLSDAVRKRWPLVFNEDYKKLWELAGEDLKLTHMFSEAVKVFNPYTDIFSYNSENIDFKFAVRQYERAVIAKQNRDSLLRDNWQKLKNDLDLERVLKKEDFEKANKNYFTRVNVAKPILKAIQQQIQKSNQSQKLEWIFEQLNEAKANGKEIEEEISECRECLCNAFLDLALKDYNDYIDNFKSENKLITYDNMIAYVQKGLHENKDFQNSILKSYDYGIIDEFQDTNGLQWDIFKTLFLDSNKFIAIVGDPKQSIYRFQGAMVEVYHRARETILKSPRAQLVTLATNYRSSEGINRFSSDLFSNDFWFGKTIELVETGRSSIRFEGEWPFGDSSFIAHRNVDQSQNLISTLLTYAKGIESKSLWYVDAENCRKSLRLRDVVVLTKSREDAKSITQQLISEGLPCQFYGEQGFAENEYWANLILLIDGLVEFPSQTGFEKFGLSSFINLSPQDLSIDVSDNKVKLAQQITRLKSIWEAKDYGAFFRFLKKESSGLALDIKSKGKTQENFYDQMVQSCLKHLFEIKPSLKQFQITLRRWVELKQFPYAGFDEYKPELSEDAIQVMTMHASKGLEFPIVFCLSASAPIPKEHKFLLDENNKRQVYRFANQEQTEANKLAEIEEYKRLLYVAYTRAILRVHHFFRDVKSPFLYQEILTAINENEGLGVVVEEVENPSYKAKVNIKHEFIPLKERIVIEDFYLQSYSSIVHKEHAEDEKTSEKIEKPVWIDDGLPAGAEFGTMVHNLLEQVDWSDREFKIEWDQLENWPRHLVDSQQEKLKELLNSTLHLSIDGQSLLGVEKYFCELEFYLDFAQENSTLWGFIDLIYKQGERWFVLDWKSNRLEEYSNQMIQSAMEEHQYPLQAKVYTYALHQWLKKRVPNYDPKKHLGGARYVFVRGVNHSESNGVWAWEPSIEDVEEIGKKELPSLLKKAKEEQWLMSDI